MRDRICTVDIKKKMFTVLDYMQYDNNVELSLIIKDGKNNFDLTGCTITAFFETPESHTVYNKNCTISEGLVSTTLDNNITSEQGVVSVDFVISKGETMITMFTIYLGVGRVISRDITIQSDPQWDILKDLIDIRGEIEEARKGKPKLGDKIDDLQTQINGLVLGEGTSEESIKQEVINARKGETTLGVKIDKIDTSLGSLQTQIDNIGSGDIDLADYQTKTDDTLNTTDKTIVGAINENKSNIDNHNHDNKYPTTTFVNTELGKKANSTDIPTKVSELTNDSKFTNETYVLNKIAEAQLGGGTGGDIDLSGYATKDDLLTKVDKVEGMGLSTNDFTTAEKTKLQGLSNYSHPATHGATIIRQDTTHRFVTDEEKENWNSKSTFNGDYNSLINKPTIPTKLSQLTNDENFITAIPSEYVTDTELNAKGYLVANDIANKVDKVSGKGLSTNDYTTAEKNKLNSIETNANNYVHPLNHSATMITQDSTHRFVTDAEKTIWNSKSNFSGNYSDLIGLPTIPTKTSQLTNDSSFATESFVTNKIAEAELGGGGDVDLSGYATKDDLLTKVDKVEGKGLSTNDFTNTLKTNYDNAYTHSQSTHAPSNAEANVQSDWNVTSTTSDAFIKNKPTIPSKTSQLTNDSNFADETFVTTKIAEAQLGGSEVDLSGYQTKIDNNLTTTSKEIVGAINEINAKPSGGGTDNKEQGVNPLDFGAVNDGETDSLNGFNNAISFAKENDIKRIIVPSGTYKISNTLKIPTGFVLEGLGDVSIVQDSSNNPVIASEGYYTSDTPYGGTKIFNINVFGNLSLGTNNHGIVLFDYYSIIDKCNIYDVGGNGIYFTHKDINGVAPTINLVENIITNCNVGGSKGTCFYLGESDNNKLTDGILQNCFCYSESGAEYDVFIGSSAGWFVNNIHTYGGANESIHIQNGFHTILNGIYVESYLTNALKVHIQTDVTISNVTVMMNDNANNNSSAICLSKSSLDYGLSGCSLNNITLCNDSVNSNKGISTENPELNIDVSNYNILGSNIDKVVKYDGFTIESADITVEDYDSIVLPDLSDDVYQRKTDSNLTTTNKTIVGAINEINAKPSGGGTYINDETTSTTETWSSSKISGEIARIEELLGSVTSQLISLNNQIRNKII